MGIPYTPSIPATNDDPADDQPLMQQNFASINTLINVDHVGFSNANYGEHNQITFAATNPPTIPTSPPVLFTNIQDGNGNNLPGTPALAELFFYSGTSSKGSTQYASVSNGSVLLFGGIVIKWGQGANNQTTGTQTTTFVNAFPNACFAVIITSTNSLFTGSFSATSITASNFIAFRSSSAGATGFNYIAIGN